jgi:hypothetical protein
VLLFGFAGFLAAWAGLIDPQRDDANLYLFQVSGFGFRVYGFGFRV